MKAVSASPHITAEWQCARCGATNRKWLAAATERAADQCVTCHAKHDLTPGGRPVRWNASAR